MIRELLRRRGVPSAQQPTGIPRRVPGSRIPLSPLQEGMWFLDRLDPGSSAYVMANHAWLYGTLDPVALQSSINAVVARHEALRTTFVADDGRPEQSVLAVDDPLARVEVSLVDLAGQATAGVDPEASALALARTMGETGFDLERAPLLRVSLARLGADKHLLSLAVHHIIADERSVSIVLNEILTGYQHIVGGGPAVAPPPVQYPDYVVWQRTAFDDGAADRQRGFWAGQLAGASGVLDLPTDRPRPPVQTFAGSTAQFSIGDELTTALDELAQRTRCTRFMIVLAAFQVVLSRWTGQDDICVGSPVSTRSRPELQSVVGLMVNSLPLRTDLSGDPTLAEVLDRVKGVCLDSLEHADLPLDQMVQQADLVRDPSRNPLFQTMCVVNPAGGTREWSSGLTTRPVGIARETSRLDLTLVVFESAPALTAVVDYNTDLFDRSTIGRFFDRFTLVLQALTTAPGQRLSELDLLGTAGRRELADWNATARDYPVVDTLHELVRARAIADPDAPAVIDGEEVLSYGELDRRAEALARRLLAAGVGPDVPVGLAVPAGPAAIVGILGVLRAGGAYLPLDPTHPPARLLSLLHDAAAPVTLVAAAEADRFADYPGTLLVVDRTTPPESADEHPGRAAAGHPDQLAYVIYTSGSTGTPKGVMVSHRTAVNLALAFADLHGIGPGDRLLMLPPLSFDASVGDIFPALASGAALVVHRRPAELTGPGLLALCAERQITLVDAPAALWIRWVADLVDAPPPPESPLRVMMIGGEAAPTSAVRDWARITGGRVRVFNHYGPTEATVCATTFATLDATELPGVTHLPIGRPVPNVRVHLLDGKLRPVPVGVGGEVYIGGTAPARGYLNSPGLTAQRFVPDPFGPPGARLYRTGDLARHRPDGTLEFLGRTDRQVKIRGHRIEVGEVEAACAAQPGVAQAAVVVRDDGHGPRLVAYLVPAGAEPPSVAVIRSGLRQRLPDYLVPSGFAVLPELPLNSHGKLDQAALPPPEDGRGDHQPPSTDTERALAAIWAKLLSSGRPGADGSDDRRVESIGVRDSFFDLGGHSLLAGPLAARITATLGVGVPLRDLLEAADLAGMAALIDAAASGPARTGAGRTAPSTIRADAELPDDVCADLPAQPPARAPEAVLITGATGFLGAHLLADWLDNSTAELHCLVRAGTPDAAAVRVRENLIRYGLWRDGYADRLVGIPGDLGEPLLGLSRRDFDALADTVDTVLHNGGLVNFLYSYERLRPANVSGTLEVLRLAGSGRPSALHLVSTLGVFLTPDRRNGVVRESDRPDDCTGLGDGYNATKWASDALVRAARERGLPVSIYRPARITGHAGTGVGNADDYFSRLLKTFVQLGAAPDIRDDPADLAPVDYVAAGIGHLSREPDRWGQDFHFYNNATISFPDLAGALTDYGYPVTLLPYDRWRAALLDRPDVALAPFTPLFGAGVPERTQPYFDCSATEAALSSAGIICPPADTALVHSYLAWYVRAGFLEPPVRTVAGTIDATGRTDD
ncbi:non-ribosomal peptide synthetase [Micromonospora sonneratiae]|uniref:Amino acid adenylation domain-containing protein n=1 Tax=Micromonospora sonneratiae TaxID=1184706 RepID=A0ABW3YK06_9ACTN